MTTETNSNRPTHRVYAVIKKEGREKGTWLEIGAAWPHRDGKGYGVTLNFIPRSPDAELVIRAIEPKPAAQADALACLINEAADELGRAVPPLYPQQK